MDFKIFTEVLPRAGNLTWGIPRFGVFGPVQNIPHHCARAHGSNIGPPTLGLSITGPSCYDRYRQYHCCSLYQQTGWNPFPHPAAAGGGSVSMATISRISHPGQAHSGLPQCDTDSRPVISAEPAHHNRVEPPARSSESSNIQNVGDSSTVLVYISVTNNPNNSYDSWDLI